MHSRARHIDDNDDDDDAADDDNYAGGNVENQIILHTMLTHAINIRITHMCMYYLLRLNS